MELTEEGKKYVKVGLPERRLLQLLLNGNVKIVELKGVEDSAIGFNWAKKLGWIKVSSGMLELTKEGRGAAGNRTELEEALGLISVGRDISGNLLKQLEDRGLVTEKRKAVTIEGEIAQLTPEMIISGAWKGAKFRKYDVKTPAPAVFAGKMQPYIEAIEEAKDILVGMGFQEAAGPFVEEEFWNFDTLFQAQNHPAREIHDSFVVSGRGKLLDKGLVERVKKVHENGWITGSKGWQYSWSAERATKLMLRSHTTAVSGRFLNQNKTPPQKMFCIDRVFRPDVLDKTHLIEFDQCDGIVMGEKLNLRELLGILKEFAVVFTGSEKVKFIPSYYPFTEPSVDMAIWFPKLGKWVEAAGAGMFRPELLAALEIKNPVIAWGIGLTRLVMLKMGLEDIRMLFAEDLGWLRQQKVV
ncbi:MAG: phenylalanine--tRNA ligase subunit alpha [Candidatus Aenigmarchaeota archaeon]|nr:phenylalanine--tRNA ligase subunit alpha [Candidatus Aenigmarchaeota archaeon]